MGKWLYSLGRISIPFLLLTDIAVACGEDAFRNLDRYVFEIDSISIPRFNELDKRIEVRVVARGEADHGDGKTYLHKTDVIRYLHEKHGFNTIPFEGGGFFDFILLNERNLLSQPYCQYDFVIPIYTRARETLDLFRFLPSSIPKRNK